MACGRRQRAIWLRSMGFCFRVGHTLKCSRLLPHFRLNRSFKSARVFAWAFSELSLWLRSPTLRKHGQRCCCGYLLIDSIVTLLNFLSWRILSRCIFFQGAGALRSPIACKYVLLCKRFFVCILLSHGQRRFVVLLVILLLLLLILVVILVTFLSLLLLLFLHTAAIILLLHLFVLLLRLQFLVVLVFLLFLIGLHRTASLVAILLILTILLRVVLSTCFSVQRVGGTAYQRIPDCHYFVRS